MSTCPKDDPSRYADPKIGRYLCTKCGIVFKNKKDVCNAKKIKTTKTVKKLTSS